MCCFGFEEYTCSPSTTNLRLASGFLYVASGNRQGLSVTADRQEWWKPARLAVPEGRKHILRKSVPQHSCRDNVYGSPATER